MEIRRKYKEVGITFACGINYSLTAATLNHIWNRSERKHKKEAQILLSGLLCGFSFSCRNLASGWVLSARAELQKKGLPSPQLEPNSWGGWKWSWGSAEVAVWKGGIARFRARNISICN